MSEQWCYSVIYPTETHLIGSYIPGKKDRKENNLVRQPGLARYIVGNVKMHPSSAEYSQGPMAKSDRSVLKIISLASPSPLNAVDHRESDRNK